MYDTLERIFRFTLWHKIVVFILAYKQRYPGNIVGACDLWQMFLWLYFYFEMSIYQLVDFSCWPASLVLDYFHLVFLCKYISKEAGLVYYLTAWKVPKYGVISGSYFPAFRLNTERYEVFSPNAEKYGPEITLYLNTFHALPAIVECIDLLIPFNIENLLYQVAFVAGAIENILTHLLPMHFFSNPWKHQKTVRLSDVFRVQRKGALGTN